MISMVVVVVVVILKTIEMYYNYSFMHEYINVYPARDWINCLSWSVHQFI